MTAWLEPGSRLLLDLVTCVLVGELLLAVWLLPAEPDGALGPRARRVLRRAPAWTLLWAASAALLASASAGQLLQVGGVQLLDPDAARVAWQLPQVRALSAIAVTGVALSAVLPLVRRVLPGRAALLVVLTALSTLVVTGHASSSASHFWAAESVLVHVVAVTAWVGGLASLAVRGRDRELLRVALPAFSRVALAAFVAVAATGLVGAVVRLGMGTDAWASTYGALLGVKAGVLVLVGLAGALHRRCTIPRVLAGRPRAMVLLATGELAVLGAGTAAAVVLARTPTPVGALARVAPAHSEEFPTIDRMIESPWVDGRLLWEASGEPVAVALVVALAVAYVAAARRASSAGVAWPARRTLAFVAGAALALWCLAGGPAAFAAGDLGIYVARVVGLGVVAPVLLALGGPLTLVALSDGRAVRGRVARRLLDPVNAVGLLVVLVGLLLTTPLLEVSFRHPLLHLGVGVAVLCLGTTCAVGIVGPDVVLGPEVDARPPLLVWALTWLVLGLHLLAGGELVASAWFVDLGLYWGDPVGAQVRAALTLVAGGAVLGAAAVALGRREPAPPPRGTGPEPAAARAEAPGRGHEQLEGAAQ